MRRPWRVAEQSLCGSRKWIADMRQQPDELWSKPPIYVCRRYDVGLVPLPARKS